MSELLKELCRLAGMLSNLAVKERDPKLKKGILKLYVMVSEKIEKAGEDLELNTGNALFPPVIEKIKETGHLVTGYKQQAKTFSDLLDHVLKIMNEVEGLYFAVELSAKPPNID